MALRKVTFPLQFAGGLDTKADEKTVPATRLLACENAVFTRAGTLAKRYGYDALSSAVIGSATALSGGVAIAKRGDEPLYFTNSKLYSYQDDLAAWSDAGSIQSLKLTHEPVAKRSTDQTLADRAALGGVAAYAWEDSQGGVWLALLDDATGRVLVAPRQLSSTATRPRVIALASVMHVYYAEATAGQIMALVVSPSDPSAASSSTASILRSDLHTTQPHYDAYSDGTKGVIAWRTSTAATGAVGYVHSSGVMGSSGTGLSPPSTFAATDIRAIAVTSDPGGTAQVAVVWFDNTDGIQFQSWSSALASEQTDTLEAAASPAGTNVALAFQSDDASSLRRVHAFWERTAAAAQNRLVSRATVDIGGSVSSVTNQRGAALASHAFRDSGSTDAVYAWIVFDSTLFGTYFCQRSDGLVVARLLPGVSGGVTGKAHLPRVQTDDRVHYHAAIYKQDLGGSNDDVFSEKGIAKVALDFASSQSHRVAELGRSAYIAGAGFIQLYDGRQVVEADFHYAPDDVAAPTQAAPAGDGVDVGTHLYRFTYEWPNAQGEWVIGAISAGASVTVVTSAQKVTFAIPTCRLTAKDAVRIGVFRSIAGDSSTLNRVSSLDPTATGVNGYVANSTTADTVTFADEMADSDVVSKEPLYTNGGILSNDPTPCGDQIASVKRRLFYTDPGDGDLVRFTQELRDGFTVEAAPELTVKLDPYGGRVTGLVEMDDLIVAFKEEAIYAFAGPGPAADGESGAGFSPSQLITSDVGCTNAASIEYTPAGVVFQSSKGIYLLGRDRSVKYIGAPVEKFTDPTRDNLTVVDTAIVPDRTQVLFITGGEALVYDYFFDQWSTFTNHAGLRSAVVDSVYHYLRTDGRVFRQTPGEYADDNSQIRMGLETAWIKLQDVLQGLQRVNHVHILGNWKSAHSLRVYVQGFEYESGFGEPFVLDPSESRSVPLYGDGLYGAGLFGDQGEIVERYQFKIHVGVKGQAFRLRFEDLEDTGVTGAAFELTELLITGGVKRGHAHVEDSRSY